MEPLLVFSIERFHALYDTLLALITLLQGQGARERLRTRLRLPHSSLCIADRPHKRLGAHLDRGRGIGHAPQRIGQRLRMLEELRRESELSLARSEML